MMGLTYHCKRMVRLLSLAALIMPGVAECGAQTVSLEVHEQRLADIQRRLRELSESDAAGRELVDQLRQIRQSIPEIEEVASDGIRQPADNRWIHRQIDAIINTGFEDGTEDEGEAVGQDESRQAKLVELEFHLGRLRRVMDLTPTVAASEKPQAERELLARILNQPEYRPEEIRESSIRQWLRRMKNSLTGWLRSLFPRSSAPSGADLSNQLTRTQQFVLLGLVPVILYLLYRIAGHYLSRRPNGALSGSQEILGLKIDLGHPPAELIERASRLAEEGEYREAIRFSFIASIIELARRDILTIDPARTNRDYLVALRQRDDLLPVFTGLATLFEEFWYGQKDASHDDYANFSRLVESLRGPQGSDGRGRSTNLSAG